MFDKFGEYMQYLLPSAFKRQKKTNQLLKYCGIIGGMYDTLLQSALRLREESIIATCSPEMLEVFGRDYDMPRLRGETDDIYRRRLQMKALIAEKAGTEHGILYALASVGCDNCTITPLYLSNPEKWAEIRINIFTASVDEDILVAWRCIVAEVMKVKKASTLPHWRIYYPVEIWENNINSIRAAVRFIFFIQFHQRGRRKVFLFLYQFQNRIRIFQQRFIILDLALFTEQQQCFSLDSEIGLRQRIDDKLRFAAFQKSIDDIYRSHRNPLRLSLTNILIPQIFHCT